MLIAAQRSRTSEVHRFLVQHSFYPPLLWSILACSLVTGRVLLTHSPAYAHMVWNLFLAWVPYLCSLWIAGAYRRYPGGPARLIVAGMLWLLFLPNAPYLLTEFIHLHQYRSLTLWYDTGLILAFAWAGCFLAVASLATMQGLVRSITGHFGGWLFVLAVLPLAGLGVYLGRYLRWNSWDVFSSPVAILRDLLGMLMHPAAYLRAYGVTFTVAGLLLMCYLTCATTAIRGPMPSPVSDR